MNKANLVPPLRFVFLMWLFFSVELTFNLDLGFLGVYPRTLNGAIGILFGPLVHGSFNHIISNTVPLLFLGIVLFLFYRQIANQVFIQCYIFSNFFVWLLGRPFYHIGASGLVYGLAAFLMAMGFFKRDFKSLVITVIVFTMYGGLAYGVLPMNEQISYESHLFGAIVGVGSAWGMSKAKKV